MDFAGLPESFAKFQRAGMTIHNNGDGWAETIAITQAFFDAGIKLFEVVDHIPNCIPLHGNGSLSVCKIAQ